MIERIVGGRRWYNIDLDTIWVVGRRHGSFMAMNLINKFIDR
jgi:predicted peptidase